MAKDNDKKNFFSWLFGKWSFWIIATLWAIFADFEGLVMRNYTELLLIFISTLVIVAIPYLIYYLMDARITKRVNDQVRKAKT